MGRVKVFDKKMSSLKVKLFTALESFLRVPPLLIVDEIFRISFGVSNNANKYYNSGGILSTLQQKTTYIPDRNGATLDEMSKSDRLDSTDNEYLNGMALRTTSILGLIML